MTKKTKEAREEAEVENCCCVSYKRGITPYKNAKDIKYSVEIEQKDGKVRMLFSCDGGKFGTDELLELLAKVKK